MKSPYYSEQSKRAFSFLREIETDNRAFTLEELLEVSGWKLSTLKGHLSKRLSQLIKKEGAVYKSSGVENMTEDAFCRLVSQKWELSNDPWKPRLKPKVEELVNKSRDSALAAVQHYNNPTAKFRSDNYIVLMIIAYTSLFHAIFERDGTNYTSYEQKTGDPKKIRGGETMLWDILQCAKYYEKYNATPLITNLEFIIGLRDKIVHRYISIDDIAISGYCQALLLNFESITTKEFTAYYSLNTSLTFALQFSTKKTPESIKAIKIFQSERYEELRNYITQFNNNLPDEILNDPAYVFRVWLIPKPANRAKGSDISIEFVPLDNIPSELVGQLEQTIVAIKSEHQDRFIDPSIKCNLWENEVLDMIKRELGEEVQFGLVQKKLTEQMIRDTVKAYKIPTPSKMYYRQDKAGSRPTYGMDFVRFLIDGYKNDQEFFFKSRLIVKGQISSEKTT